MKQSYRHLISFNLSLLVLCLSSCVEKRDLSENTAIVHLAGNPNGLHITNDISAFRHFVFEYIHKTPVKIDLRTLKISPVLVRALPEVNEEATRYTYSLRDDVRWDDGTPLTASDVVFSTKLVLSPLTRNMRIKPNFTSVIKAIEADPLDPLRFTLVTHTPGRANAEVLSEVYLLQENYWDPEYLLRTHTFEECYDPSFKPSDALRAWFDRFNAPEMARKVENMPGLGPYRITTWVDDSYIVLEKKTHWWGDADTALILQNHPDKIIFRIIRDESALYYALRNENIDAVSRLGLTRLLKLQQHDYFNARYQSAFVNQYGYNYIGLNTRPDGQQHKPLFTDRKVRRAMAYLVPVDDIVKVLYKDKALRQTSFLSPLKAEYHQGLAPIPFDPEEARRLLDEAGWKDSDGDHIRDKWLGGEKVRFSFKLNYMSEASPSREIVLMIKEEMYKAGIEVIPNPLDFALFYEKAYTHDFDALMGAWQSSALYEDPSQLWHTGQWANGGANFCGFGDASSDSLIAAINREVNDSLYFLKVKQLQQRIYDDQPYIFLFSPQARVAIHRRFEAGMYSERPQMAVNAFRLLPGTSVKSTTPDIVQ